MPTNHRSTPGRIALLAAAVATVALTQSLHATPRSWNLNNSGNWGTAANWSPSGVPGAGDDLTLTKGAFTVSLDVNANAQSAFVENGMAILAGNANQTLNVGSMTLGYNNGVGYYTLNNGTLNVAGNLLMGFLGGARVSSRLTAGRSPLLTSPWLRSAQPISPRPAAR